MEQSEIGILGLGGNGARLAWRLAEHGHAVAALDHDPRRRQSFLSHRGTLATAHLGTLLDRLQRPRMVMLDSDGSAERDRRYEALQECLEPDDVVVDLGTPALVESAYRAPELARRRIRLVALGLSPEPAARGGLWLLAGGSKRGWQRLQPLLDEATTEGSESPGLIWFGRSPSAAYLQQVRQGVAAGTALLSGEIHRLLQEGLQLTGPALAHVYRDWGAAPPLALGSHHAFSEELRWLVHEALHLDVQLPVLEALAAHAPQSALRHGGRRSVRGTLPTFADPFIEQLRRARTAARLLILLQGLELLQAAGRDRLLTQPLNEVATLWGEGGLVDPAWQTPLEEACRAAATRGVPLTHHPRLAAWLAEGHDALREVTSAAILQGYTVPALTAALFDCDRYALHGYPTGRLS